MQPALIVFTLLCLATSSAAELPAVPDKHLSDCIIKIAQKKGWNTATELTDLECHNMDIANTSGLEQFPNLVQLSLYRNKLENIDISVFKQLRHLNVAKNQLKSLTIENAPALEELFVFGNRLEQLHLVDLPELKLLKANDNQLTLFEYTNLPVLEKLYLFDNQLENMDIHHLPAAVYMDVRQNPMPDALYDDMDNLPSTTVLHDGNAEDWQ